MELPELPEAAVKLKLVAGLTGWIEDRYTAEQMQEYARQAVLMEREACAMVCDKESDENCGDSGVVAEYCAKLIRSRT